MTERSVQILNKNGLHARPAAQFVKTASGFQSEIRVRHSDKTANAKSILEILTLDAGQNAKLIISAEGAETALDALEAALKGD